MIIQTNDLHSPKVGTEGVMADQSLPLLLMYKLHSIMNQVYEDSPSSKN